MKKSCFILIIVTLFFSAGCTKSDKNIIEIGEKMFLGQVNDVYLNKDDYLGKTLKLEGILLSGQSDYFADPFYFVVRYGPGGCCGIDGIVGFEVAWADKKQPYPENDSWVEVTGELKTYEEKGNEFLIIDLHSLNVLDVRGKEFISQ